jgi:hypothetical protein
MPQLTINGIYCDAPENATLLEAAAQMGIAIPTLCHAAGKTPQYLVHGMCGGRHRKRTVAAGLCRQSRGGHGY